MGQRQRRRGARKPKEPQEDTAAGLARDATEQALIDAIVRDPDDDAPRLVYADFLETRGESARGELVQIQCQIARMADDDPRKPPLLLRVAELNRAHAKEWLADLWSLELPQTKFGFERGCVETIATPFSIITTRAKEIIARAPCLSRFELSVDGQADRVRMARPEEDGVSALVRARHISVKGRHSGNTRDGRGPIGDLRGLGQIAFQRLQSLRIDTVRTDSESLGALLSSPHLANLKELTLALYLQPNDLATILTRDPAPTCTALERLDLSMNPLEDDGIALLAQSNLITSVKDLRLVMTRFGRRGLGELLQGDRLRNVERLWLNTNSIGDEGARMLAEWRGGQNLWDLFLRDTGVTEQGKDLLLRSPQRSALRSLIIDRA